MDFDLDDLIVEEARRWSDRRNAPYEAVEIVTHAQIS